MRRPQGAARLTRAKDLAIRSKESLMDDSEFWGLISKLDWDFEEDDDKVVAPVPKALSAMTKAEITSFQNNLTEKLHALDGRAWVRESGEHI
jgi:hypothetical protein